MLNSQYWWVFCSFDSLQIHLPLGTTISATCTVGSMYCSNAGLTNLLYCLMTPAMSRPRSVMSLFRRLTSRMSESVSTNTFMSSSWTAHREREIKYKMSKTDNMRDRQQKKSKLGLQRTNTFDNYNVKCNQATTMCILVHFEGFNIKCSYVFG